MLWLRSSCKFFLVTSVRLKLHTKCFEITLLLSFNFSNIRTFNEILVFTLYKHRQKFLIIILVKSKAYLQFRIISLNIKQAISNIFKYFYSVVKI